MKVVAAAERGSTRGSLGGYGKAKLAAFLLGFLLILSELCCLSSAVENIDNSGIAPSHWSPARKARFFHTQSSSHHARTSRTNDERIAGSGGHGTDDVFQDDKRIVHTGPNPLHN